MSVNEKMTAIANAVRGKTGGAALLTLDEIADAIEALEVGGGTPTITVSSSGLITATAGDKSATKQLTAQAAKTVTPSTSSQTAVAKGRYTTGAVTVAPIPSTYIQPTGTLDIYDNGTHDVTQYESVNVQVAVGGDVSVNYVESADVISESCSVYAVLKIGGQYMRNNDFFDDSFNFIAWVDLVNKCVFIGNDPPCSLGNSNFSSGTYTFNDQTNGYLQLTYTGGTLRLVLVNSTRCKLTYVEGFCV